MPHDANGVLLQKGDRVIVKAEVTEITSSGEEACNVSVQVLANNDEYKPLIAMNSKNVYKDGSTSTTE